MSERMKALLGIDKKTEYEKRYFDDANTRAGIYMSVVVIILEIWMILRVLRIAIERSQSMEWLFSHLISYVVLLAVGVAVLVNACGYFSHKRHGRRSGRILRQIFSTVCIVFGMYISYKDYIKGEQILTFVTMVVFVAGLYAWRPITSIVLLSLSFGVFFMLIDNSLLHLPMLPQEPASAATRINLFIMWISVVMVSQNVFYQRAAQAQKDENLERINRSLHDLAVKDELTGINNKHNFNTLAVKRLESKEEEKDNYVFLYCNISNFKAYNEKYGFAAGNELLKHAAKRLERIFQDDICARFSDDQFAVLARESVYKEKTEEFEKYIADYDKEVKLGLKTGVYRHKNGTAADCAAACDNARYACATLKKKGHISMCEYDEEMAADMQKRQYIINAIDKAIENGWIKAYYQPVVWAENNHICGAEALARWDDPQYGFLSPAAFIPVLEEYHQIHKLDAAIVDIACAGIRSNIDSGYAPLPVSVNFSRLDFELMDVVAVLEAAVEKYGIDRRLLHVEITESALTENEQLLRSTVLRLKEKGYPIWLDDFGSGYSSLNVLKDFDVDVLKLDMQFLAGFSDNEKSGIIIDCILKMADRIGIKTLSEGVETRDEAEFLRDAGCERLQGYLIGRPMPIEELNARLRDGTYIPAEDRLV